MLVLTPSSQVSYRRGCAFVGALTGGARAELRRVPVFRMAEEIHSPDADASTSDAAVARRARRARDEAMTVSLRRTGGIYDVQSESGHTYRVDLGAGTCSCPDWQQREPEGGCKHLRRVRLDVQTGQVPTPDGRLPDAATEPRPEPPRTAADGGASGGITGPHLEFDRYGQPTGETYYRCACGREAIQRSRLDCGCSGTD